MDDRQIVSAHPDRPGKDPRPEDGDGSSSVPWWVSGKRISPARQILSFNLNSRKGGERSVARRPPSGGLFPPPLPPLIPPSH